MRQQTWVLSGTRRGRATQLGAQRLGGCVRDMHSRSRTPVAVLMLAVSFLLSGASGCFTTTPERHLLGLVALQPNGLRVEIMRPGVRAMHCKSSFGSSGDLGAAVDSALAKVDGATILVNASVYTHQRPAGVCIEVVGDAAVLY